MEIERSELARASAPILGMSPCKDRRNLLVTMQSHAINVYEVFDHKCIMSWNLPPDLILSVAAVQSFSSGRFFCIQDKAQLLSWSQNDLVINSWKKKKIEKNVVSLLVSDAVKDFVFLVFENGTFCAISEDLQHFAAASNTLPHPNAPSSYVWSHLAKASTDRTFLFNIINNDNKYYFGVHEIHTGDSSLTVTTTKYHLLEAVVKQKIAATTFDAFSRNLSLIWTDGTWEVLNFASLEALLSGTAQTVSTRQLNAVAFSSAAGKTPKKRKTDEIASLSKGVPVGTAAYRSSVLAMAAVHDGEPFVTFWDMRFAALLGSLSLNPADESATGKGAPVAAVQVCASLDHRFVAVALDQRVYVCLAHCPAPSLALSVGSLASSVKFVTADIPDLDMSRPPIAGAIDLQKQLKSLRTAKKEKDAAPLLFGGSKPLKLETEIWREQFEQPSREEEEALRKLVVDAASSEEEFTRIMREHLERTGSANAPKPFVLQEDENRKAVRKTDSLSTIAAHIQAKKDRKRKLKALKMAPHVSQYFLVRVTNLCVEWKFWRALRQLLKTRLLALPAVPALLTELRKQNRVDVLEYALKFLCEISEAELVACAQYFISSAPRAEMAAHISKKKFFSAENAPKVSEEDALQKYLNIVVAKPKNDVFMIQYLKELTIPQLKTLLQYLVKWLDTFADSIPTSIDKREHLSVPSFANVLDWLNMVIDSHLTKLLLMDEWQDQIVELKQLVNSQVDFCDRIQPIKGQLMHLINGGSLPSQERLTDYSIEILKF